MFDKIAEEFGTELPLTDRMLLSTLHSQKNISFYITSGDIIKPADFFKRTSLCIGLFKMESGLCMNM